MESLDKPRNKTGLMPLNLLHLDNRDVDSFSKFFESFYPKLCHFAEKYVEDSDASVDIVQEAFVYYWKKFEGIHSVNSAKSYLFKFVKDKSLNYLRDRDQRRKIDYENLKSEHFFRDVLVEKETYEVISSSFKRLSPQSQRVIEYTLDGFKNQEIADQLMVSVNTVKTIKLRAFKKIRENINRMALVFMTLFRMTYLITPDIYSELTFI